MVTTHSEKKSRRDDSYQYLVTCSLHQCQTTICANDENYAYLPQTDIREFSQEDSATVKLYQLHKRVNRTPLLNKFDAALLEEAFYDEENDTQIDDRHGFISMLLCAVGLSI